MKNERLKNDINNKRISQTTKYYGANRHSNDFGSPNVVAANSRWRWNQNFHLKIQKISQFQQLGIPTSFADQMLLHQTLDGVECKISLYTFPKFRGRYIQNFAVKIKQISQFLQLGISMSFADEILLLDGVKFRISL